MTCASPLNTHDRGALPRRGQPHFFYLSTPGVPLQSDVDLLATAAKRIVENQGLGVSEIAIVSKTQLSKTDGPDVLAAFHRVAAALGFDVVADSVSLLVCEWASAHEDGLYSGNVFASFVLRTGPHPYAVQTFQTKRKKSEWGDVELQSQTRMLRQGDMLVFDPTMPHMAAPFRSHQDQLLVLMQAELPLVGPEARENVLRRFPRHPNDYDCRDLHAAESMLEL